MFFFHSLLHLNFGEEKVTDVRIVPAISAIGKKKNNSYVSNPGCGNPKEKMKAHFRWFWLLERHME